MNRLPYISVISLLFFLISIFTIGCAVASRDTTASLQGGVAAIDITPTVGDVHYRGSSTGVLDPLMAKAGGGEMLVDTALRLLRELTDKEQKEL